MSDKKSQIGLAGEYRVASELLQRGFNAVVTLGNAKATDVIVLSNEGRYLRVEVKTSKNGKNFVTGFYPKYTDENVIKPDIWVLYSPAKESNGERFFIMQHKDVSEIQLVVNRGKKTEKNQGVDNIPMKLLVDSYLHHEGNWGLFHEILTL